MAKKKPANPKASKASQASNATPPADGEKPKHPGGRPRKAISETQVFKLASMQATLKEMAAFFDCSEDTLQRRFSDAIKRGQEVGKSSLRRMQFKAAREGNPSMLKWLGQQYLGQSDRSENINVGLTHLTDDIKSPSEALRELREKIDSFRDRKPQQPEQPESSQSKPQSSQARPNIGPPRNASRNGHSPNNGNGKPGKGQP